MQRGYIRLWRKLADSKSASRGANHIAVMVWMLLHANWCERYINGICVERGQLVTSVASISTDLRISVQSVRTVLHNLTTDGFLTIKSTNKFSVVTILNFSTYQAEETPDQQTNQQTSNKQVTNKQQQQNNYNNYNNYNMCCPNNINNNVYNKEQNPDSTSNTATENKEKKKRNVASKPSSAQEVIEYCKERNNGIDGQFFWDKMESRGWVFKDGRPVKDWKACIRTWERYNKPHPAPQHNNSYYKFDGNTAMERNPELEREDIRDF